MAATRVSSWATVTALPPARAGSATGQRDGPMQQPGGEEPQYGEDVAQQYPDQLVPGEQPAARDRHERHYHEGLVGDGIEHRTSAGGTHASRQEAVGDVAGGRGGDDRELPGGRADQRKQDGERKS